MSLRLRPARSSIGFIEPCLPSPARAPPAGDDWLHEIKHDGYRMMVRGDGGGVRIITRRGYDWTDRYPLIAAAARQISAASFLIDGEAVLADERGLAIFELLRRRTFDRVASCTPSTSSS
jgi:bifunctional non-homologous end joining protein LigD